MFRQKTVFLIALTACLCFCVVSLEAENFFAACTACECGCDCALCLRLQLAQDAPVQASACTGAGGAVFFVSSRTAFYKGIQTGVKLKVRLNR
ncbi:MAG: hypothetical protein LBD86_01105 [Spirochaetaceae bacterium]|nr:hypothetical protein [Spirochaetaceae bacterium]